MALQNAIGFFESLGKQPVSDDVVIGTQTWKLKNVASNILGSKVPNNDEGNRIVYGGLYLESMFAGIEALYPGYHIPTMAEWITLSTFLGGDGVSGGYLKEAGVAHWITPNTDADNSSGFTALPAGYISGSTVFQFRTRAYFCCSDSPTEPGTYGRLMFNDYASLSNWTSAEVGFYHSVRLIKD